VIFFPFFDEQASFECFICGSSLTMQTLSQRGSSRIENPQQIENPPHETTQNKKTSYETEADRESKQKLNTSRPQQIENPQNRSRMNDAPDRCNGAEGSRRMGPRQREQRHADKGTPGQGT